MLNKPILAIEGIDRIGKSTLIKNILNKHGYYEVIHFKQPKELAFYAEAARAQVDPRERISQVPQAARASWLYQVASFKNSLFLTSAPNAKLIFDRWYLGEAVYAPLYRGYSGDYVFELELGFGLDERHDIGLILLTVDFDRANHLVEDGHSLGGLERRQEEQALFIEAFNSSCLPCKRLVCVTDPVTGNFKPEQQVLEEAMAPIEQAAERVPPGALFSY